MSDKNRDGKRTARERLREEREREAAREKRRRAALAGGGVVAALAVAAAVAVTVSAGRDHVGGSAAGPAGATGKAGLAVPVGDRKAPATLTVYEDFRCPACDGFERTYRTTVHSLIDSGRLKGEYHLVRLIDGNLGGSGSLRSGNAAACAQAQGQGRFRAFHDVLFDNQPEERDDAFASNGKLLQLAAKVPGLRTPAFTSCVDHGTYDSWVDRSNRDFQGAGFGSTPTVLLNGKNIYADNAHPLTPAKLVALVAAADKGRTAGSATPSPAVSG